MRLRVLAERRTAAAGLALFGVLWLVYLGSLAATRMNSDAFVNSYAAWHFAHTGSPFLDGEPLPTVTVGPDYFQTTAQGHVVIARTPAQMWAAAPFYLMIRDDFTPAPGSIAAAFWTAAAGSLLFAALVPRLSRPVALGIAAIVGLTTPMWSVSAATLWPHCVTVLALGAAALALSRGRWFWAGVALGVGLLARPHIAVVAAVVGLGVAFTRRSPRTALALGAPAVAFLAMLAAWNRWVFGAWSVTSGYDQNTGDLLPGDRESRLGHSYGGQVLGFLASADKGFLVWTPLVLVLLPLAWRHRAAIPDWASWLAAGGVAYSAVQLAVNEFTGGSGFNGYRLGLELLVCLTPALGLAAVHAGRVARWLAAVAVVYQAATTAVAAWVEVMVPEDRVWKDNSSLAALREEPVVTVVLFLVVGALAGCAVRLWWIRAVSSSSDRTVFTDSPPLALASPDTGR